MPCREDDVLRAAAQLVAQGDGPRVVEPEDPGQRLDGLPALVGVQLVGRPDEALALDGRGEHDGPGPVVDLTALARRVERDGRLGQRFGGQPLLVDDLPVGQARRERERADGEDDEQEEEPAARVGAAQHRLVDRLARRQDDGVGQLSETRIDGLLADRRLAAEAVEVRTDVGGACRRGPGARARSRPMSSPVAETRTCWASEKKASMNATTIAPRIRPSRFVCRPARNAPAHATPVEHRTLRRRAGERGSPIVRGRAPS